MPAPSEFGALKTQPEYTFGRNAPSTFYRPVSPTYRDRVKRRRAERGRSLREGRLPGVRGQVLTEVSVACPGVGALRGQLRGDGRHREAIRGHAGRELVP